MLRLIIDAATLAAVFSVAAMGLSLIAGRGGMLSLAHAACIGAGAYAAALSIKEGFGVFLVILSATLAGSIAASIIAATAARLRDDAFAIVTFALQILFISALYEATTITRGALGITGVSKPVLGGLDFGQPVLFLALCSAFTFLSVSLVGRINASSYGRALTVVREDEAFALAIGLRPILIRTVALIAGGTLAGLAGALYAYHLGVVTPAMFGIMDSVLVLAMVLIGGAEARWGPVLGAVGLVTLPEILRFLGVPLTVAAEIRTLLYGAGLVAVVFLRPSGVTRPESK